MSDIDTQTPVVSSLAAPTEADLEVLRAMTPDQRRKLIADEIEKGSQAIAEGRYTVLETDDDITNFFDELWPV